MEQLSHHKVAALLNACYNNLDDTITSEQDAHLKLLGIDLGWLDKQWLMDQFCIYEFCMILVHGFSFDVKSTTWNPDGVDNETAEDCLFFEIVVSVRVDCYHDATAPKNPKIRTHLPRYEDESQWSLVEYYKRFNFGITTVECHLPVTLKIPNSYTCERIKFWTKEQHINLF